MGPFDDAPVGNGKSSSSMSKRGSVGRFMHTRLSPEPEHCRCIMLRTIILPLPLCPTLRGCAGGCSTATV